MKKFIKYLLYSIIIFGFIVLLLSFQSAHFLDYLIILSRSLILLLFLIVFSLVFVYIKQVRKNSEKLDDFKYFFAKFIVFFILFNISFFSIGGILNFKVRNEIKAFLKKTGPGICNIKVDGCCIETSDKFFDALRDIHGSLIKPVSRNKAKYEIICRDSSITLLIAKDPRPEQKNMYWVYCPKYRVTKNNNVGVFKYQGKIKCKQQ